MIVNTCGWVDGQGYELLKYAIQTLGADAVIVLGDDSLHAALRADLPSLCPASAPTGGPAAAAGSSVALVNMPSSGGARRRGKTARADARRARVRTYFYGKPYASAEEDGAAAGGKTDPAPSAAMPLGELAPYSSHVPKADLRVLRIGGAEVR